MNAPRGSWWRAFACGGGLLGFALACPAAQIYSCVDANGKKLTSDRPIAECHGREQRVLNRDGSVREVLPPTPTADERAEAEARERQAVIERMTRTDALRRDRNLLNRFPNEGAHNRAREAALEDSRQSQRRSEVRIALLTKERKPLLDEAEFYVGKPLPARLRQQLDANDAAKRAQEDLIQSQQSEMARIHSLFDVELERLRRLWAGEQPGSMGVLPVQPGASAPRRTPVSRASASESR